MGRFRRDLTLALAATLPVPAETTSAQVLQPTRTNSIRRDSVLVLVVAVLGVLFVVGLGFLAMARQDRQTADSVERRAAVNLVATAVINQVHATLSEDLWDGGSVLLGDGTLMRPAPDAGSLVVDRAGVANVRAADPGWLTPPAADWQDFHACLYDERWMQARDAWSAKPTAAPTSIKYNGHTWGKPNKAYMFKPYGRSSDWTDDDDWIATGWANSERLGISIPASCFGDWDDGPSRYRSTIYRAGDIVRDPEEGTYWQCLGNHTTQYASSPASYDTFAQWRTSRPGFWQAFDASASHDFDTLGQLHLLMTVGPEQAGLGTAVSTRLTTADAAALRGLYLDFSDRRNCLVLRYIGRLTRRRNGEDDNNLGGADDISEFRMPGLVNINTATPHVLRHLDWYLAPRDPWSADRHSLPESCKVCPWLDLNQQIYNYRTEDPGGGFQAGVGELMKVDRTAENVEQAMTTLNLPYDLDTRYTIRHMNSARNCRAELAFYAPDGESAANPIHLQATSGDLHEKHFIFDRISDLATDRSDTFLAYILVEEIRVKSTGGNYYSDADVSRGRRQRTVAIFDRSVCNYPPTDSQHYIPPQLVARSVSTCEIP